jgi:hypothetical protein
LNKNNQVITKTYHPTNQPTTMEENLNPNEYESTENKEENPYFAQEGTPVTEEATRDNEKPEAKKVKLPEITLESLGYLNTTAKWTKFLAIMGFIAVGLMVLLGIFMGIMLSFTEKMSSLPFPFPMGLLGLIYIYYYRRYLFFSDIISLQFFGKHNASYRLKRYSYNDHRL